MYINKKIEIRGSFPHLPSESFKNNLTKKEKRSLNSSLSMSNICLLSQSTRQFGKDLKNIINLTVNTNFPTNDNIEEKIKYYRKINDELTKMLNEYDKNFFEKNKNFNNTIINKIKGEKNSEKCLIQNMVVLDENKNCKKIKINNKDNNTSYFENFVPSETIDVNELNNNNKDNNVSFNDKNLLKNENKNNNNGENSPKKENNKISENKKIKSHKKENNHIKNNSIVEEKEIKSNIMNNPQEMDEYFEEIFYDIQLRENSTLIDPNYLKNTQKSINHKMRAILIDWLIDVHKKYKLKPETMYLTTNIIDRYLSKKNVETINLQLVGVVALLISSKYEDIYPPKVKELAEITDGAYIPKQLIEMEEKILSSLNFDLFYPTQWHFLECYKKTLKLNKITFFLAWYLMELSLIDINIINYKGSIIASSAVLLAMKNFKIFNEKEFEKITGFSCENLENCVKDIKHLWINNKNEKKLTAVRRKFSHIKYCEVTKIKPEIEL